MYTYVFGNLGEIDQYLQRHNLSKKMEDMNRPVSIKEIESRIKTFQPRNHHAQMGSLVNSTKHLRKKLYQFPTINFRG